MRAISVPLICLILLAASAARAADGLVNGQSYAPLPPAAAIDVRLVDESGDNADLRDEFVHRLRAAGHRVVEGAPLILEFGTHGTLGTWGRDNRYMVEMHARGGDTGGDDAGVRFNLYNSTQGGLFNPGSDNNTGSSTRYRLDALIAERQTGKRLWQGWATAELSRADSRLLTRLMVEPLVSVVGRTVRKQTFPIPR